MPDAMPGGTSGGWGRAPHGGRDLNVLMSELAELSGQANVALPVAVTLAGLWAVPAPAELAGEAAARAMFRGLLTTAPPGALEPVDPTLVDIPAIVPEPAAGYPRVLPGPAGPSRPVRRRRRAGSGRGWSRTALIVSAGAATIAVGGVALASILSSPTGQPGPQVTVSSAARGAPASGGPGRLSAGRTADSSTPTPVPASSHPALAPLRSPKAPAPQASSSAPASARAAASPAGPGGPPAATSAPAALCTQFFAFFTHVEPPASWAAELALYRELGRLAGSPEKIYPYCAAIVPTGSLPAGWPSTWPTSWPARPGPTASSLPQPTQGASRPGWP